MSTEKKEHIISTKEGIKILPEFSEATDKNIIQVAHDLNFVTTDPKKARKYLIEQGFKIE